MKIKYLLLETIDNLKRINPWRVNLIEEINKIRGLMKERLNLVIAGIAADNASYIFNKKIDEIERIVKYRNSITSNKEEKLLDYIEMPDIDINYGPQKYMIDLTEIIDKLEELLEKEVSKKFSTPNIEPPTEDLLKYTQEEIKRAENYIISYLLSRGRAYFTTLAIDAYRRGIHPLYILYAILFLEQEEIINTQPIYEGGDVVNDIIITKET